MKFFVVSYFFMLSLTVATGQDSSAINPSAVLSDSFDDGGTDSIVIHPSGVYDSATYSNVATYSDGSFASSDDFNDASLVVAYASAIDATSTDFWGASSSASYQSGEQGDFERTVILIYYQSQFGQNLFIRGGHDHNYHQGCGFSDELEADNCSIPIRNRYMNVSGSTEERDTWTEGDDFLDWYGAEVNQSSHNGNTAQGTPAQWTSNDEASDYFFPLNVFGEHYWVVDVDMDCSKTDNGFFEFKAFLDNEWEPTYSTLDVRCQGEDAEDPPHSADNHFAKCGYINVYEWGQGQCSILSFD